MQHVPPFTRKLTKTNFPRHPVSLVRCSPSLPPLPSHPILPSPRMAPMDPSTGTFLVIVLSPAALPAPTTHTLALLLTTWFANLALRLYACIIVFAAPSMALRCTRFRWCTVGGCGCRRTGACGWRMGCCIDGWIRWFGCGVGNEAGTHATTLSDW